MLSYEEQGVGLYPRGSLPTGDVQCFCSLLPGYYSVLLGIEFN